MSKKEGKYQKLRYHLDKLGYSQPLSMNSVLLVERLLDDMESYKMKAAHYEDESKQKALESDRLEQLLIPIRNENENLTRENNHLHQILIKERDLLKKSIKDLEIQISDKENSFTELEFKYMEQLVYIDEMRQEILSNNEKLLRLDCCTSPKSVHGEDVTCGSSIEKHHHSKKSKNTKNRPNLTSVNNCISEIIAKIPKTEALKKLEELQKENSQLKASIEHNNYQVEIRENEIQRLGKLLEKRMPKSNQVRSKCNCKCCSEDNSRFPESEELQQQLLDAQQKQHVALEKVTSLMNMIKVLEMKSAVEARPKSYDSSNSNEQLKQLQEELKFCKETINSLEKSKSNCLQYVEELKKEKEELGKRISSLISENMELNENLVHLLEDENNPKEELKSVSSNRRCRTCDEPYSDKQFETLSSCGLHKSKKSYEDSDDHIFCPHKHLIKILTKEKNDAIREIHKLQRDVSSLRDEIMGFSKENHRRKCNNKIEKLQLEDKIKSNEVEKQSLITKLENMTEKWKQAENKIGGLYKDSELLTTQCANWKAKYNHSKMLTEHMEISLKNAEEESKQKEQEIKSLISKNRTLESEKESLEKTISALQKERNTLRGNLHHLDRDKDALLEKLDDKTVQISKLDSQLKQKTSYIINMEQQNSKLLAQFQTLEQMLATSKSKALITNEDVRKMEAEISALESVRESLLFENRRLQDDIGNLTQDNMQLTISLEKSRKEVENLKARLQSYVEEVRRVEELLQLKERERDEMLEQFKILSAEATHLESNNQSLEFESSNTKKTLQHTQDKLENLRWEIDNKTSLFNEMENKITDLSSQVAELQLKNSEKDDIARALSTDLETARNLCSRLQHQKMCFDRKISELQKNESRLDQELQKIKGDNEHLVSRIAEEQNSKYKLEDILATSRQEAMETSISNHDLKSEVSKLQQQLQELESKMQNMSRNITDCQQTCSEYRSENLQLHRTLTNEQFEQAKVDDSSLSFSTSL